MSGANVTEIVKSITIVMLSLVSVSFIFIAAAQHDIAEMSVADQLSYIDKVGSLISLDANAYTSRALVMSDLPLIFQSAADDSFDDAYRRYKHRPTGRKESAAPSRFGDQPISGRVSENVPMHTAPGGECDVAQIGLSGTKDIEVDAPAVEHTSAGRIAFIAPLNCGYGGQEGEGIFRIRTYDDQYIYILPFLVSFGLGIDDGQALDDKSASRVVDKIIKGFPPDVERYAAKDNQLWKIYTGRAISAFILDIAEAKTGVVYSHHQLPLAVDSIFSSKAQAYTFQGIPVPSSFVVKASPILLVILVWELWRKSRALLRNPDRRVSDIHWFASDVDDIWGRVAAVLWSLVPFFPIVTILLLYPSAVGVFWNLYGTKIDPLAIISLHLTVTPPAVFLRSFVFDPYSEWDVAPTFVFGAGFAVAASRNLRLLAKPSFNRPKRKASVRAAARGLPRRRR